jgi:hypothetical protein
METGLQDIAPVISTGVIARLGEFVAPSIRLAKIKVFLTCEKQIKDQLSPVRRLLASSKMCLLARNLTEIGP